MKVIRYFMLASLVGVSMAAQSQSRIDSVQFFLDEQPLTVTLSTDIGNVLSGKLKDETQDATFTFSLPDSSVVSEKIKLNLRKSPLFFLTQFSLGYSWNNLTYKAHARGTRRVQALVRWQIRATTLITES